MSAGPPANQPAVKIASQMTSRRIWPRHKTRRLSCLCSDWRTIKRGGAARVPAAAPPQNFFSREELWTNRPFARGPLGVVYMDVLLNVNGRGYRLNLDVRVTLLDALRETLGFIGTKKGCDQGQCGACTVLIDGRRVLSCFVLAAIVEGTIMTIEGLAGETEPPHPMQQAFIECDALQCGYCTPGQSQRYCLCRGWTCRQRGRNPRIHERQSVPLRRLPENRGGDRTRQA